MRHRNHVIYSNDQNDLARLKEEYEMLGRQCKLITGVLTVFALPQRSNKPKQDSKNRR